MGKGKQQGGALDIASGVLLSKLALWLGVKSARGAKRLMFRWRRALSPLVMGFLIWLVSAIWHWTVPAWGPLALVLVVGGLLLAVLGPKLNDGWSAIVTRVVPAGLDKGRTDVLDRTTERIYFGAFWTAVGGYIAVRATFGPSDLTLWWWRSGVVLFGGAWWYHRRVRTAGKADRVARKWNRISDRSRCPEPLRPIAGAKVKAAWSSGRTTVLRVQLPEALTIASVSRLTPALASYYKMRPNSIFVREDEDKANCVFFSFLPKDPWSGNLDHAMPTPGSISLRTSGKKFIMGLLSDGTEREWKAQHTGVYGQSGSGKSAWLHSLMVWLTACSDALVVAIDMANGATMNQWRRTLARPLATDLTSAAVLLERVLAFIADRERQLGIASAEDDDADDSFQPTDEMPWLFLIMDEFPDLINAAKSAGMMDAAKQLTWGKYIIGMLGQIAKRARKTGVRIVTGSQNATKEDNGSKEFQGQLTCVIGMSMDGQQSKNLWGTLDRLGWTSTHLTEGQFLQRDQEHTVAERAKGFWVPNRQRRAHIKAVEALHKGAEESAWAALMGADMPIVDLRNERESTEKILRVLGEGPKTVHELTVAMKCSRATVYRELKRHETTIRKIATGPDAGKFALAGDTSVPIAYTGDAA
jgi:hypothetical protein